MNGDRQGALADADRAAVAARQRRDNPGLAEALTLSVLASRDPAMNSVPLREAIEICHETGCHLREATTRIAADRIGAVIPHPDAHCGEQMLRGHDVDVDSPRAAGPLSVLARSSPALSIRKLGVFKMIRDGIPIPNTAWQSKKTGDLLKILVAAAGRQPREQLMELLWPGVDPTVAGKPALHPTVHNPRRAATPARGDTPLAATDGAVALNPAQVPIDVEDFLSRANAAFDAYRAGSPHATTRRAVPRRPTRRGPPALRELRPPDGRDRRPAVPIPGDDLTTRDHTLANGTGVDGFSPVDSVPEGIGEGPAIWVDDCGWPEFDASALDGDVPALEVDLLVVHGAQQATVVHGRLSTVSPVPGVVCVAHSGRPVAAGKRASAVSGDQRAADAQGDGAHSTADV